MIKLIIYPFIKNGTHIEDDWNRPIYFAQSKQKPTQKLWLCDVNCRVGAPAIHFVNRGTSYNYDADPDFPLTNYEIK